MNLSTQFDDDYTGNKKLNISLDFDDTYTRDPDAWNSFIQLFQSRGHTVYCVTARSGKDSGEVYDTIGKIIGHDKCIFANFMAKSDAVWKLKIRIDVWIDDSPYFIINGTNRDEGYGLWL
jgi:acid phosphatase class B